MRQVLNNNNAFSPPLPIGWFARLEFRKVYWEILWRVLTVIFNKGYSNFQCSPLMKKDRQVGLASSGKLVPLFFAAITPLEERSTLHSDP